MIFPYIFTSFYIIFAVDIGTELTNFNPLTILPESEMENSGIFLLERLISWHNMSKQFWVLSQRSHRRYEPNNIENIFFFLKKRHLRNFTFCIKTHQQSPRAPC